MRITKDATLAVFTFRLAEDDEFNKLLKSYEEARSNLSVFCSRSSCHPEFELELVSEPNQCEYGHA